MTCSVFNGQLRQNRLTLEHFTAPTSLSHDIKGVSKNWPESGEQYIVVSPFSFVFPGCLTRRVKNAARIVLSKSTMKLNNFASDNVSVNSKPDHPPQATPGDSHILVAPGVGFSILCLARGSARGLCPGVSNQSKSSIILKKSAIFALSLKQLSSNSFHMFIYARSEKCDFVPIYTITNTQHIRICPGKLRFILVKISSDSGQRKPNSIHVSYY